MHAIIAIILGVLLFVPAWRDRESAYFVIEPTDSRTIAAAVAGQVDAVFVQEGQQVHAGQALLRMTSIQASSMHSDALAHAGQARFRSFNAQMQGASIQSAAAEQVEAQRMTGLANEAVSSLLLKAPVDGIVMTENPAKLTDENVGSGEPLVTLAEGARVARIFIPTTSLDRVIPSSEVALAVPGEFSQLRLRLATISGGVVALPAGIVSTEKYKGLQLPVFYSSVVPLPPRASSLAMGTAGRAIVFGRRRSIADHVVTSVLDVAKTHVWW